MSLFHHQQVLFCHRARRSSTWVNDSRVQRGTPPSTPTMTCNSLQHLPSTPRSCPTPSLWSAKGDRQRMAARAPVKLPNAHLHLLATIKEQTCPHPRRGCPAKTTAPFSMPLDPSMVSTVKAPPLPWGRRTPAIFSSPSPNSKTPICPSARMSAQAAATLRLQLTRSRTQPHSSLTVTPQVSAESLASLRSAHMMRSRQRRFSPSAPVFCKPRALLTTRSPMTVRIFHAGVCHV